METRSIRRAVAGLAVAGLAVAAPIAACGPAAPASAPAAGTPTASTPPGETDPRPAGATETARVVRVVDGDTLVIDRGRGEERLRYIGVDAPESVKPDTPVEFMGREASAANAALVEGRDLVLERDVSDTDQFGRLLRHAWLHEDNTWRMVGLELVRTGYAQAVTYPPDVRWTAELRAAERAARDAGAGLWGEATPLP
jgi:endonuclease YncB( thermonuclease family)